MDIAKQIERAYGREQDDLYRQLQEGRISRKEYDEESRRLQSACQREIREAAEEAAQTRLRRRYGPLVAPLGRRGWQRAQRQKR